MTVKDTALNSPQNPPHHFQCICPSQLRPVAALESLLLRVFGCTSLAASMPQVSLKCFPFLVILILGRSWKSPEPELVAEVDEDPASCFRSRLSAGQHWAAAVTVCFIIMSVKTLRRGDPRAAQKVTRTLGLVCLQLREESEGHSWQWVLDCSEFFI